VALRRILTHPDAALRAVCTPVLGFDDDLGRLAGDMLETMYAAPGQGLAAPQVGVLLRLFVMDVDWKTREPVPQVMVNPRLVAVSRERVVMEEACLSIPGLVFRVDRPAALRLAWQGLDGSPREARFSGLGARAIQHELDHLDGILCLDRAAPAVPEEGP
jgi:peptide deformylase